MARDDRGGLTVLTDAMRLVEGEDDGDEPPHPSITVRDATIAGLEGIKEGEGCWVALYQRATGEIQNCLSLY